MNEPTSQVDQQLLELVRRKPPEDLTPAEIELLQKRLGESAELREAMAGQLRMEEYLAAALGAVNLPVDEMIKRSGRNRAKSSVLASPLGVAVAVLLLVGVIGVVIYALNQPGNQEVVQRDDEDAENPEEQLDQAAEEESPQDQQVSPEEPPAQEEPNNQSELPVDLPADLEEVPPAEVDNDTEDTQPVTAEDSQLPPADFQLILEAENFTQGNVLRDEDNFGTPSCVIIRRDEANPDSSFVEYEFDIPVAGEYEFALRYASFESRPLKATLNGQSLENVLIEEPTGGWHEIDQRWQYAAPVHLQLGQNALRLEAVTVFPHLDKFSITTPRRQSDEAVVIAATPRDQNRPWERDLAVAPRSYENVWFRDLTPEVHAIKLEEVSPWFDDANLPVLSLMAERRKLLTKWEDELNGVRAITPVRIEGPPPEADKSVEFTQLEDGSYLVSGVSPERGTYTLWFEDDLSGVDTITLEAIGHEWLPNGGPGRSAGSALLTRLHIYQGPEAALTTEVPDGGEPAAEYRLAIAGAEASHSLNGYPVVDCLDDRTNSGWGLDPNRGIDHRAQFRLSAPISADSSGWLRIDMHQDFGAEQMFGRFRFLVPTSERPEVPPEVREVLNIVPSSRSPEQMKVLIDYLAPRDPRLAVLTEEIVQLSGEGSALNWELGDTPKGNSPRLQGIGRLRSPWFEDAVLRLEIRDYPSLKIHFFHGNEGATLVHYGGGALHWAGYCTERHAGQSTPHHFELTAYDAYRDMRTGGMNAGPIDLRYSNGEVILSRGDIELMRVPLAGEPEDVYLEGSATIAGINMYRAADLPPAPSVAEAVELSSPANLEWDETQSGDQLTLERRDDGSLHIAGEAVANACSVSTPLELLTPAEIVLELSDVSPGMCLYLGQGNQEFKATLNFVEEPGGGRMFAVMRDRGQAAREQAPPDPGQQFAPLVGDRFWVKLIRVDQMLRCWLSVDGIHWAEWGPLWEDFPRQIDRLGFYHVGAGGDASLTLNRLELRPLAGLANLVDAEILRQAVGSPGSAERDAWLASVDAERPPEIEETAWRQARALRLLAQGASVSQSRMLLDYLFESVVEQGRSIEEQIAVLHATSLLLRGIVNNEDAEHFQQRYVDIGRHAHSLGEERPYTLIHGPILSDPWVYTVAINWGNERLQNWELVYPIYQGDWQQVANICRGWEFLHVEKGTPLTEWAMAKAEESLAGGGGSLASFLKQEWLPPVSPEIDKYLYNQIVNLETTVDSDAIEEACNLIRRLEPGKSDGLAPTRTDPQLYVSIQAAIALTMSRRPEVRESIQSQYEDIAKLRVQAAARNGDYEALRLASLQFYGTQAALEASMRLGDRALSAGDFERAIGLYRQSANEAQGPLLDELLPRIRLTAALMGRDVGQPASGRVSLGDASYSAEEFETLVAEMRVRSGDQSPPLSDTPTWRPAYDAPAPTAYAVQQRAVFDGPAGANIPNYSVPMGSQLQLPWVERQMATVLHDKVLYVNNRFQVSALNVEDGTRLWQNALPFGDHQFDMRPFTPMKPVLIPDQLVCRMLTGPTLIGMRQDNGQRVWNADTSGRVVCSDPVIWHEKLFVLVRYADTNRPPRYILALETYNPTNGTKLGSVDLVSLWQSSYLSEVGQLTICGNQLLACYEGATLCLDEEGRVLWLRQHATMPEGLARYWVLQDQQPVLYEDGLIYASLPGMRKIECMEPESGRSRWRAVLGDLRGIAGFADGVLIARSETGFVGYDSQTGERLWRKDFEDLCEGYLSGGPGGLACVRRVSRLGDPKLYPELVWLDPRTGEEQATFTLESLGGPDPQVGPLVNLGDKLWLFHAPDLATVERQIYELSPDPAVELGQRP